jgi:hypothetical protein
MAAEIIAFPALDHFARRSDRNAPLPAAPPLDVETVVADADLNQFGYRACGGAGSGYRCLMRSLIRPVGSNRG